MKLLIALLTAATGILHLLVGFDIVGGFGTTNWMLVLNGVGYLVLLFLYWTATGSRRGTIRWILLAYALITLIGYFVINGFGFGNTIALVIKGIELLLIILLLLDRGSDRVVVQAPTTSASRGVTGMDSMRTTATSVDTTVSSMASSAAAGVPAAAAGAAAGAVAMGDRAYDATEDVVEEVGDTVEDAYDATADVVGDAADAVGDTAEDAADAIGDAVDDMGDGTRAAGVAMAAAVGDIGDDVEGLTVADAAALDAAALDAEPTAEELRAELEQYLRSFGPSSEFRKEVEYVEGIGPVYGQKLRDAGIATILDLMVNGATRRGRKHISDQTGLAQSLILTWVNHVDLFRIKGVAQEYADLLEQSGVDTVVELAQRNPANLHKRMLDINEQKSLVRRAPHASEVQSWVEQAKDLRRLIHY